VIRIFVSNHRFHILAIAVLAGAGTVRADICVAAMSDVAGLDLMSQRDIERVGRAPTDPDHAVTSHGPFETTVMDGINRDFGWSDVSIPTPNPADEGEFDLPTPTSAAIELPGAPGSAQLFLSALVSVGAWQVVRLARGWQLAWIPDWYHDGGPGAVGLTAAAPPDLISPATAPLRYEFPTIRIGAIVAADPDEHPMSVHRVHALATRGPPFVHASNV